MYLLDTLYIKKKKQTQEKRYPVVEREQKDDCSSPVIDAFTEFK